MRIAFVLLCLTLPMLAGAESVEQRPFAMPRSVVVPITDTALDRQYELYIKLPENYSGDTDTAYPVIYTTDAEWHMDLLSGTTEYLMPKSILVGISWQTDLGDERKYASRFRDYSVVESPNPEHQARYNFGQAADFLAFVRSVEGREILTTHGFELP